MFCPSVIDLAVASAARSGRMIERALAAIPLLHVRYASALRVGPSPISSLVSVYLCEGDR
jgi:hypothetical protein